MNLKSILEHFKMLNICLYEESKNEELADVYRMEVYYIRRYVIDSNVNIKVQAYGEVREGVIIGLVVYRKMGLHTVAVRIMGKGGVYTTEADCVIYN